MDLIAAFRTYIRVAEAGSFSVVAREGGATQPAVSRQIASLEEHLGTRLIQRTTRRLTLTDDGRDLLAHARRVLEAVEEAEAAVGRGGSEPVGLVRLAVPSVFGRIHVAPKLRLLLERYPGLSVELHVADRPHDLVAEGLDLAIRAAAEEGSSLITRRVGSSARLTLASAEYVERRGVPAHPGDLAHHECITFLQMPTPRDWHFEGADGPVTVHVGGRFSTDGSEALREAVLAGLGVALLPAWYFRDELADGRVRALLRDWQPPRVAINAVYPSRRHLAPRVRAVIDFLVHEFRADPTLSPDEA